LRCSDVLAITIGDAIAGTGKRIQIADEIIITEQKTGHKRQITINETMKGALRKHIKRMTKKRGELDLSLPLFLSRKKDANGRPKAITRHRAGAIIRKAAKKVGIRGSVGMHGLRKTFAYHSWKNGAYVDVLQKVFHHSSVEITHRYASIPTDYEREIYKKMKFSLR
jgi:integrase